MENSVILKTNGKDNGTFRSADRDWMTLVVLVFITDNF
jgi:hypothetical protein